MTSIIDNLISSIQDDKFIKSLSAREAPPLGVYLQWLVESEKIAEFKEGTPEHKVAHQLRAVPLRVPGDISSKVSKFAQNINLFYPAKETAETKGSTGPALLNWEQIADATALAEVPGTDGEAMPARAVFNKATRSSKIDGEPVSRELAKERNDVTRPAFARAVVAESLRQVKAGIDAQKAAFAAENGIELDAVADAGFKPDFSKVELSLFGGLSFYGTAVQNGEYVNIDSSAKKGGKPFARELPEGEEYGFAQDQDAG